MRLGDRNVKVSLPDVDKYPMHTPVLIDDIISTARTMIETVKHVKDAMQSPVCVGVHGVFSDGAYADLKNAGAKQTITCTIPHASNQIDLSPLIIQALQKK